MSTAYKTYTKYITIYNITRAYKNTSHFVCAKRWRICRSFYM